MNYKAIGIGFCVIVVLIIVQKNILPDERPEPSPVNLADIEVQDEDTPTFIDIDTSSEKRQNFERVEKKERIKIIGCEGFCGEQLVEALKVGYDFTEEEIELIEQNPQLFAQGLIASPDVIEDLLASFFADEGGEQIQRKQRIAHIINEALSSEDKALLGDQLAVSDVESERRAALKLFSSELNNADADLSGFLSILENETDPRILLQAINLSKTVSGIENKQRTVAALNQGIGSSYSDYAISRAIIAMAELNVSASDVNSQILNGIQSYSDQIRSAALEALSVTLDNQLSGSEADKPVEADYDMVFAVQQVIDDPYAEEVIKRRAQNVLNQIKSLGNTN